MVYELHPLRIGWWLMVGLSRLIWPESGILNSGAGLGCTPDVQWSFMAQRLNQPSTTHTLQNVIMIETILLFGVSMDTGWRSSKGDWFGEWRWLDPSFTCFVLELSNHLVTRRLNGDISFSGDASGISSCIRGSNNWCRGDSPEQCFLTYS